MASSCRCSRCCLVLAGPAPPAPSHTTLLVLRWPWRGCSPVPLSQAPLQGGGQWEAQGSGLQRAPTTISTGWASNAPYPLLPTANPPPTQPRHLPQSPTRPFLQARQQLGAETNPPRPPTPLPEPHSHCRHGSSWAEIARSLPGRTDQQCMGRWRRHLDPAINRESWEEEEDEVLRDLVAEFGEWDGSEWLHGWVRECMGE